MILHVAEAVMILEGPDDPAVEMFGFLYRTSEHEVPEQPIWERVPSMSARDAYVAWMEFKFGEPLT